MSKKMDFSKQLESHGSISQYEQDYDRASNRKLVVVKNGNRILKLKDIRVTVGEGMYGTDLKYVNINWEEAELENYKDFKLYGIYSSVYCKIEYNHSTLVIYSDNGITIEIN